MPQPWESKQVLHPDVTGSGSTAFQRIATEATDIKTDKQGTRGKWSAGTWTWPNHAKPSFWGVNRSWSLKNLKLCPNLTFSQEKYTELFDQIEWSDMVWHFYAKFFLTLARTSLKSTLLQSLAINWTACTETSGVYFFQNHCLFWHTTKIFMQRRCFGPDFLEMSRCTTSAPRGFINIFCSSWSNGTCSRHKKISTFTLSQRWSNYDAFCVYTKTSSL